MCAWDGKLGQHGLGPGSIERTKCEACILLNGK